MLIRELFEAIEGLPPHVELHPNEQKKFGNRYRVTGRQIPRGKFDSHDRYEIELHPDDAHHATTFAPREGDRPSYYDPELSDLVDAYPGEKYSHRYAKPKAHLATDIEALPDPDIIYRGISFEEYQDFLKKGYVQSLGTHNFSNQEGLTYWSTEPGTAVSYANGFAPMQFKPTFKRPAYVVAAHRPARTIHVPGTGENEVGVPDPINMDQIVAVWQGNVYQHKPGKMDVVPFEYGDYHRFGSGVGPDSSVVWQRIAVPEFN